MDLHLNIVKMQQEFMVTLITFAEELLLSITAFRFTNPDILKEIIKILNNLYNIFDIEILNIDINYSNAIDLNKIFKDENLIAIIKYTVNNTSISQLDLENIYELDCKGKNIKYLDGIENLINLKILKAGSNPNLNDITKLKQLTNLTHLKLGDTSVKNIKPLYELKNLIELSLFNCIVAKDEIDSVLFTLVNNNKELNKLKLNYMDYNSNKLKNILNKGKK